MSALLASRPAEAERAALVPCPCCGGLVSPLELLFDDARRRVVYAGSTVRLAPAQYLIFQLLADRYPRVVTNEELILRIGALGDAEDGGPHVNNVKVHVCRLRKHFDPLGLVVSTIWGVGYVMEPSDAAKAAITRAARFRATRNVASIPKPEQIVEAGRLRADGWPVSSIAQKLRLTYRAVTDALQALEASKLIRGDRP
jgi:DNA-binding winged helix-turn-helix (wHTH) protein